MRGCLVAEWADRDAYNVSYPLSDTSCAEPLAPQSFLSRLVSHGWAPRALLPPEAPTMQAFAYDLGSRTESVTDGLGPGRRK